MKKALWFLAVFFPWGLVVGALLALLVGCAVAPIRLGPGECAVLTDRDQIIVAGSDCKVQRLYR